jgi:hypothetical protein
MSVIRSGSHPAPTYLPLGHFLPIRWCDRAVAMVVRPQPAPRYRSRVRIATGAATTKVAGLTRF